MRVRNTIQKTLVMEAVANLNHPTAEQIYAYIAEKYSTISRGTVYRNLNQQVESGELRKVVVTDGADHYDTTLADHYHIRCKICGIVADLRLPYQQGLLDSVIDTGGFLIEKHDILVSGICPKCLAAKLLYNGA